MKCPYCGSVEYEAQDIIRNDIMNRIKETCVCFNCEKVFDIEYHYVRTIKVDGE